MSPVRGAPDVQHSPRDWRRDVAADSGLEHRRRGYRLAEYRMGPALENGLELDEVSGKDCDRIGEAVALTGVGGMALIALRQQIDHHEPALRDRKIQVR